MDTSIACRMGNYCCHWQTCLFRYLSDRVVEACHLCVGYSLSRPDIRFACVLLPARSSIILPTDLINQTSCPLQLGLPSDVRAANRRSYWLPEGRKLKMEIRSIFQDVDIIQMAVIAERVHLSRRSVRMKRRSNCSQTRASTYRPPARGGQDPALKEVTQLSAATSSSVRARTLLDSDLGIRLADHWSGASRVQTKRESTCRGCDQNSG